MLGVGETEEQLIDTLKALRANSVDVVTFGQYMRPTKKHMKVSRYVEPSEFEMWKKKAEEMGFAYVASGPLVRSSYKAGEYFIENMLRNGSQGRGVLKTASLLSADTQPGRPAGSIGE
ncbi:lipoic acid synthetase [Rhizoctonia solani AG-1 IB]|nr:lipoic acid synthetase [Rhizoctonia solani AG-1 IB]